MQKKVSLSTVNKTLNKYLSKPKNIKKVFFLSSHDKIKIMKFLQFMKKIKFIQKIFSSQMKVFLICLHILIKILKSKNSKINQNWKCSCSKKSYQRIS